MKTGDRRLIEDYLPLNVINAIAAKDKKHPKHPVSLVHYWPARRPITACRAAIYAALVPAPSTDEEREEAASFIAKLAAFKPASEVVSVAKDRILKQHEGEAPEDPRHVRGRWCYSTRSRAVGLREPCHRLQPGGAPDRALHAGLSADVWTKPRG